MKRKKFIQTCGFACLGGFTIGGFLQSCKPVRRVSGFIEGDNIIVPLSEFEYKENGKTISRSYIIVQNSKLKFPLCVYRTDNYKFSALLMRCTHQGTELTVYGDKLHCSAHGSEFDKIGNVTNGPAVKSLRRFSVNKENHLIKISIKEI